jgi:hypothetical protein
LRFFLGPISGRKKRTLDAAEKEIKTVRGKEVCYKKYVRLHQILLHIPDEVATAIITEYEYDDYDGDRYKRQINTSIDLNTTRTATCTGMMDDNVGYWTYDYVLPSYCWSKFI